MSNFKDTYKQTVGLSYCLLGDGRIITDHDYVGFTPSFQANRYIAGTRLTSNRQTDDYTFLSTVFLCIDHNFSSQPTEPVLFETMLFNSGESEDCYRTGGSVKHALRVHMRVLSRLLSKNYDIHIRDIETLFSLTKTRWGTSVFWRDVFARVRNKRAKENERQRERRD